MICTFCRVSLVWALDQVNIYQSQLYGDYCLKGDFLKLPVIAIPVSGVVLETGEYLLEDRNVTVLSAEVANMVV